MTIFATIFGFTALSPVASAQHIVLRDLTLVENVNIDSMDIDGLVLSGGLRYSWADVLQGEVGDKQIEFDSAVKNIGLPLFRIRTRMANGSYRELQPMADELLAQSGNSQGRTAYIALAASFQDLLARGQREAAVVPLLRLLSIRNNSPELSAQDSNLGLRFADDGICLNLLPVWFDKQAATAAAKQLDSKKNETWSPAASVYQHSLWNGRNQRNGQADIQHELDGWQPVLTAQSALLNGKPAEMLKMLDNSSVNLNAPQQVIALYYRGLAMRDLQSSDPERSTDQWKLKLLQIPAQYQDQFPELAAAAIYQVLDGSTEVSREFESLQTELTDRFSQTWHGRRYQSSRK